VLLHGGITDSRVFAGNLDTLADRFRVFTPERRGHGHTPDVEGPLTVALMVEDTIAFLERVVSGPARLAGYSAGAVMALGVALRRPDLVRQLVLVSGVFHRDGWVQAPTHGRAPDVLVRMHDEVSPDGGEHVHVIMNKIADSALTEPAWTAADLGQVACPTLVVVGDDDLVHVEHALALYRGLPAGQLAVLPNASHLLLLEHPLLGAAVVGNFLLDQQAPTRMPIRRAPAHV
jgi:pimeloyl-ACP methyl ester carboxylesterase